MTRTATEQRYHRTYSGPGTFTCREDRALVLEVVAERARLRAQAMLDDRNQWRNA